MLEDAGRDVETEFKSAGEEVGLVSGNGYSNGGEVIAKGVPTICEGE